MGTEIKKGKEKQSIKEAQDIWPWKLTFVQKKRRNDQIMCHYKNHRSRKESKSEVKGVVGYENNNKIQLCNGTSF